MPSRKQGTSHRTYPFKQAHPALALWAEGYGWLEIGATDMSRSLVRVLDEGGMVWEVGERAPSLAAAMAEAENAIAALLRDEFGVRTLT